MMTNFRKYKKKKKERDVKSDGGREGMSVSGLYRWVGGDSISFTGER